MNKITALLVVVLIYAAMIYSTEKEVCFMINNYDVFDLTHSLNAEIPTWDGHCGFQLVTKLDYADCTTEDKFRVQKISTNAGIGTHIDAPRHCFSDGVDIASLSLESLIVPCIVIDVSKKAYDNPNYKVTIDDIDAFEKEYSEIKSGSCVMFYTGWSQYWPAEKYRNNLCFPSISIEVVQKLLERNVVGIGIDTLSPDCEKDQFPVHRLWLGAGNYIIENVANLKSIPAVGSYCVISPLKIAGGTESPIRLIAFVPKN
jgi:kynurenine formamidase